MRQMTTHRTSFFFAIMLLLALVLLTSCGSNSAVGSQPAATPTPEDASTQDTQEATPQGPEPTPTPTNDPNIVIDWVSFIRFNGIMYVAVLEAGRNSMNRDLLSPVHDTVKFNVADNIKYIGYETKDGDAAYINPGTKVYEVKGYSPSFRLAVPSVVDDTVTLFEADTNTKAKTGAELMDIKGKVQSISLKSPEDATTELGVITDPATITKLIDMIMTAAVDHEHASDSEMLYFLDFQLNDKTITTRPYWDGSLGRGILVPKTFTEMLAKAVKK